MNNFFPEEYFMDYFRGWQNVDVKLMDIKFIIDNYAYLTDCLDSKIDSWNSGTINIISAPTGSGKNFFISHYLLKRLVTKYPGQNNLILILSNRIAANRQSKFEIANLLKYYSQDDTYKNNIDKIYQTYGIDERCINFGIITISTYHQLYERHILDNQQFKYIICDECHFFTSDSLFNLYTNEILKEIVNKGQQSIRIYMSATPEVAFEPIIYQEMTPITDKRDEIENSYKDLYNKEVERVQSEQFQRYIMSASYFESETKARRLEEQRAYLLSDESYRNLEYEIKKETENIRLHINFYYIKRNYDYIDNIFSYKKDEDLIDVILHSRNKWLIFVLSERSGSTLEVNLKNKKIDCIFISRYEVNRNDKEKEEYDFIINHNTISKKVVITTSILDNGINIKNDNIMNEADIVSNIVIDNYDRTQFIQMLGRIRPSQNTKVNLYIKETSIDKLKTIVKNDAGELLSRLTLDLLDKESPYRYRLVDNKYFYINNNHKVLYNHCAIYQLLSRMISINKIIKNNEKSFVIPVPDNLEMIKEKLYHCYRNNYIDDYWRRTFIDLFEDNYHAERRKELENKAIENGQDISKYRYTLDDTFYSFLLYDILAKFHLNFIEKKYNDYLDKLNPNEKNWFKDLVIQKIPSEKEIKEKIDLINERNRMQKMSFFGDSFDKITFKDNRSYYEQACSLQKKCKLLKERFSEKFIDISLDYIEIYINNVKHYQELAKRGNLSLLEEQLSWIEKSPDSVIPIDDKIIRSENIQDLPNTLEDFIKRNNVSLAEINNNKKGNYIDGTFLQQKGILKDAEHEKLLSQNFFEGKPLTELLQYIFPVDGINYQLQSFNSNQSGHKTFYLFVKAD